MCEFFVLCTCTFLCGRPFFLAQDMVYLLYRDFLCTAADSLVIFLTFCPYRLLPRTNRACRPEEINPHYINQEETTMGKKVTIIGAGSVGSTIAYTMAVNGIATEVVMIDINESKSLGEALDIRQGVSFCPPISIYAGSYQDPASPVLTLRRSTSTSPRRSSPRSPAMRPTRSMSSLRTRSIF